jgi:hypothetical protein
MRHLLDEDLEEFRDLLNIYGAGAASFRALEQYLATEGGFDAPRR